MEISEEEINRLRKEVDHWKSLYFQSLQRNQDLEAQLGTGYKERKPPSHERPYPSRQEDRRQEDRRQEDRRQEDRRSSPPKNKTGPKYIKKQDHQLDQIKNKLRLACSNNDKALLIEAINEAEEAGMNDIDHAKRKLNSLR
ncbi:unnamed protein product [Blepharisma stoltei]|uniref:Uncharacterized protein n=1 Tax=Blepharisma stoltei TaxID=1481888 RepID=A0AAU9K620_9CILI|nr:unnamed protein product [Blepharisma stoltei]